MVVQLQQLVDVQIEPPVEHQRRGCGCIMQVRKVLAEASGQALLVMVVVVMELLHLPHMVLDADEGLVDGDGAMVAAAATAQALDRRMLVPNITWWGTVSGSTNPS